MARSRGPAIAAALTSSTLVMSLLVMSLLGACNPFVTPYKRDPAVELHREGETMAAQWNGTLAATPGSGTAALSGVVTATPGLDGASTYVSVTLASAPPGAAYPWQLREGACGGSGGVVGPAGAYGPLAVNAQGRAAASATVPLRLSPGASYHVRLGGAATPEPAVACADLTRPTR